MATYSSSSSTKKTKGRQKVNLVRMEKDSNRQVTFSKRRCGLFKKASELCTLCGAEVAVTVYSPGRKAYTFGHPSVDSILKRFVHSNYPSSESKGEAIDEVAQRNARVNNLNHQLNALNKQMEMEQKSSAEINGIKKGKEQLYWWDHPVEELSFHCLVHLQAALDKLMKDVLQHGKNLIILDASNADNNHFPIMTFNHRPMLPCFDGAMFNPNHAWFDGI